MTSNKQQIIFNSAIKLLEQQNLVRLYIKKKVDKKTLDEKGIKLMQPI